MRRPFLIVCLIASLAGFQLNRESRGQDINTPAKNKTKQAQLGVGVTPLHPAISGQLSSILGKGRGVMVGYVVKGSPAEQAGLRVYDLIVSYDEQDVYSTEQLVKLVRNDKPGRKLTIGYVRGGQLAETNITLGEIELRPTIPQRLFGLTGEERFNLPRLRTPEQWRSLIPDVKDTENWAQFESLSISRNAKGVYTAKITYRDQDQKLEKTYEGTREELQAAIGADKELPEVARDHLLRGLDMKNRLRDLMNRDRLFRMGNFEWGRFDWPNLDF